jgi:hypothetical protein
MSQRGRSMPLDAKGVDGFRIEAGLASPATVYTSHFATCPNAATHRKPRAAKAPQLPGLDDGPGLLIGSGTEGE